MPRIQGCWTCRLRRKKCSSEQPTCSTCLQLNVTCYGYSSKPSWKDGGTKEQEVSEKIRRAVKWTTDSQRQARALRGLKTMRERRGLEGQGEPEPEAQLVILPHLLDRPLVHLDRVPAPQGLQAQELLPLPWSHNLHLESFLLKHYLDVIFPLQFPFYRFQESKEGRRWFLNLLMRAKPLYNAALSLAAWHHKPISSRSGVMKKRVEAAEEPEKYYSLALAGLREHIGVLTKKGLREGLKDSIEVNACVVQLILFEIARGGFENWQTHLLAAPDIHPFLQTYCTYPSMPTVPLSGDLEKATKYNDLSFVDHAAMEFFSGVIIYLDILACASTGLRPQYADICAAALGERNSKLQLKNIIGCENWAMVLIREIAILWDWKRTVTESGVLSAKDLGKKAGAIEQRLDVGLERLRDKLSRYSKERDSGKDQSVAVCRITQAYARAGKVYLSVLVSGPDPELPEISNAVASTLAALTALSKPELLRSVVWPFCIAGCIAYGYQRQAFRDLASAADVHQNVFGTSWRALEVMEMCWKTRDVGRSCDWLGAMEVLGYCVLLV